jgi:hypothetical protein
VSADRARLDADRAQRQREINARERRIEREREVAAQERELATERDRDSAAREQRKKDLGAE